MKKILFLAANSTDTNKLRLDEELREIETVYKQSRYRDEIKIISKWAVRVDDLRGHLLDNNPDIVHFSGHGAGDDGLVLENQYGQKQFVSSDSLKGLFKLFKDDVECVVLNACYSEVQAEAIYQHINCVVGMNKAIGDKAAIKFATGFYQALAYGRNYQDCFYFGCNAIDLQSISESETPQIKIRDSSKGLLLNSTDAQVAGNNLSFAQRLEKESLETELEARKKDFEDVSRKYRRESNPAEKNNLQAQKEELIKDIERIERELNKFM